MQIIEFQAKPSRTSGERITVQGTGLVVLGAREIGTGASLTGGEFPPDAEIVIDDQATRIPCVPGLSITLPVNSITLYHSQPMLAGGIRVAVLGQCERLDITNAGLIEQSAKPVSGSTLRTTALQVSQDAADPHVLRPVYSGALLSRGQVVFGGGSTVIIPLAAGQFARVTEFSFRVSGSLVAAAAGEALMILQWGAAPFFAEYTFHIETTPTPGIIADFRDTWDVPFYVEYGTSFILRQGAGPAPTAGTAKWRCKYSLGKL